MLQDPDIANVWAVTGGTGSIGRAVVESLIKRDDVASVRVISRSESNQAAMAAELGCDKIRYILGDVRDKEKMKRAFSGVHTVVHAAALKRVESCEYNPDECQQTNIDGSDRVAAAAMECHVNRVVLIGTDKSVNPQSLMGMSKTFAERMFLAFNSWSATRFWVVRLGNVLYSTGSVLPQWERESAKGFIEVTDPAMTRFYMTKQEVADFVMDSLTKPPGLYVPQGCRKILLRDLAEAFSELHGCEMKIIGRRDGEKTHEELLSDDEAKARGWCEGDYKSNWGATITKAKIKELLR